MFKIVQKCACIISRRSVSTTPKGVSNISQFPDLDLSYLCDPNNFPEISENILLRKGVGDIRLVNDLKSKVDNLDPSSNEFKSIREQLYAELCKIPNRTHPDVIAYNDSTKEVKQMGTERIFEFAPREFYEITKRLNLVRTDQLGNLSGNKSYYILGELAELEQALIQYTLSMLLRKGFRLVSVPDILPRSVLESCGMNTKGTRTQVYSLDHKLHGPDLCLSGTSEMALAAYFSNKVISENDLPIKLATVSQCYRAETSSLSEEKGIYRVHQFAKVEMFALSKPGLSDSVLEEIRVLEEEIFSSMGLYLRTLDMPPHELGAQAYRKYDVEAWLAGRKIFGEISSCSNCTDYQSRRLNITFNSNEGVQHVHTLNGTACAVPRMLIALIETFQNDNGTITVPTVLQKYMTHKTHLGRQKKVPELSLIKHKKYVSLFLWYPNHNQSAFGMLFIITLISYNQFHNGFLNNSYVQGLGICTFSSRQKNALFYIYIYLQENLFYREHICLYAWKKLVR